MTPPKPFYQDDQATIYHGDSFDVLPHLSGIGAVVTDPPYSSGGASARRARAHRAETRRGAALSAGPSFAGRRLAC